MGVGSQRKTLAALHLGKRSGTNFKNRSGQVRKTSSPLGIDLRNLQPVTSEISVQQNFVAQGPFENLHT